MLSKLFWLHDAELQMQFFFLLISFQVKLLQQSSLSLCQVLGVGPLFFPIGIKRWPLMSLGPQNQPLCQRWYWETRAVCRPIWSIIWFCICKKLIQYTPESDTCQLNPVVFMRAKHWNLECRLCYRLPELSNTND